MQSRTAPILASPSWAGPASLSFLALLVATACGAQSDGGDAVDPNLVEAGFGVADISPTDEQVAGGQVYMGGYGLFTTRGAVTDVADPLYARAMVVRNAGTTVIFEILDAPGASNRVIGEIVAAASEATGVEADAIFVGSTHTHAGPDLQGLWGNVPLDYRALIIEHATQAIVEAHEALTEVQLSVSKGRHDANNRRDWGYTNDTLTVLDAQTPSGNRVGTLIQFAAHPVTLPSSNTQMSRDFTGFAVDFAQDELGAPVLYFNGDIGDCSPISEGGFQGAESYGTSIAQAAIDSMDQAEPVSPGIVYTRQHWDQHVTNENFKLMDRLGWLDYDTVEIEGDMGIEIRPGYFRLGEEVQGVAFPGEALTRTGERIREHFKTDYELFLGLTTNSLGYFVPSDEWMTGRNGDYEEGVSTGESAGDTPVEVISAAIEEDNTAF